MSELREQEEVIFGLEDEIKALKVRLNDALQAYADSACPLNVGDQTIGCGYSFKGKKCVVIKVFADRYWNALSWGVKTAVLKADGSRSKTETVFRQHHWEKHQAKLAHKNSHP